MEARNARIQVLDSQIMENARKFARELAKHKSRVLELESQLIAAGVPPARPSSSGRFTELSPFSVLPQHIPDTSSAPDLHSSGSRRKRVPNILQPLSTHEK